MSELTKKVTDLYPYDEEVGMQIFHIMCKKSEILGTAISLVDLSKIQGMPPLAVLKLWQRNSDHFKKLVQTINDLITENLMDKVIKDLDSVKQLHKDEVPAHSLYWKQVQFILERKNRDEYAPKQDLQQGVGATNIIINTGVHFDKETESIEEIMEKAKSNKEAYEAEFKEMKQ